MNFVSGCSNVSNKQIPAFGALVAKQFKNFNQKEVSLEIEFTIVLRIIIDNLDDVLIKMLTTNLRYRLNETDMQAPEGKIKISQDQKSFIAYTIRGNSSLITKESMRLTPFDILSFRLKFELSHVSHNGTEMRFNFHMHYDPETNLSFKNDHDYLPEFNIMKSQSFVEIGQEFKDNESAYYPILYFIFKIHREPFNKLLTIFLPQFILGSVIILTNKKCQDFDNKISIIATLLLAFIAFIPSLRAELPSLPYATLSDYIIYTYMVCCIVPLLSNKNEHQFSIDIAIYILAVVPILIIMIFFCRFYYLIGFQSKNQKEMKISNGNFDANDWSNPYSRANQD